MITIKSARRAGVPLVAVETTDPTQSIQSMVRELTAAKTVEGPLLQWDYCRGIVAMNKTAEKLLEKMLAGKDALQETQDPNAFVNWLARVPEMKDDIPQAVIFWHNAQRFWNLEMVMQGIWNLRDIYKRIGATCILLCPSANQLPEELRSDTVVLTDSLPSIDEVREITDSVIKDAGMVPSSVEDRDHIHDTLLGLPAFAAEQVLAMSIGKNTIDRDGLWTRKIKTIEQTRGLSVYRGKETFADIGGLSNAKKILTSTITGKTGVRAIVFIDEIDKGLAAARTDTSGTSQDQLKVLLTYMQDNDVLGILMNGPPGVGKTVLCKAAANEHGILNIFLDLGAMKGSLVGESEKALREAVKVIHAITDGKVLFIGACNHTGTLPPELRRRFNFCSMFVDLPDARERESMWKIWKGKYNLTAKQCTKVDDDNWTGAEIRNACLKAWAMGITLTEAQASIVPVAISAKDEVEAIRTNASGKYISAHKEGMYVKQSQFSESTGGGRKISGG